MGSFDGEIFDDDGYPADEFLGFIASWDFKRGFDELMVFAMKGHTYRDRVDRTVQDEKAVWTISTGGWSGNESIICALMENTLFWMMCWVQSRRGGHYIFECRLDQKQV